jgi:hypothetical protein
MTIYIFPLLKFLKYLLKSSNLLSCDNRSRTGRLCQRTESGTDKKADRREGLRRRIR